MSARKQAHNALIRARAESALADLYHNATVTYPRDLYGRTDDYFQLWFEGIVCFEIEYLQDGGAYGNNYHATLAAVCNAGKYKSECARQYYIAKGVRSMHAEREDCGALIGWHIIELAAGNITLRRQLTRTYGARPLQRSNSRWECISDYGTLYQYGRSGRTLAPDGLWREDGCGHGCKVDVVELSILACVDLIRIVESFNEYVRDWCKGVPDIWREHCEAEDQEARAEKRAASQRKARETRERNSWACRGVVTL